MYEPIVKLEGVAKRFGSHEVLKDLSFSVPKGSVFAFLGNNGQGKSSTIRLMTGLLRADRGEIRIAGLDINKQRQSILADFVSIERSTIQGHKSGLGARRSPFFWKKARG